MTKKFDFTIVIMMVLVLSHCTFLGIPVDGSGSMVTTQRQVTPFTEIEASGKLDMELVADSLCTISIEAQENLVPYIRTEVKNHRLIISTTAPLRSTSPVRVMVTLPAIARLEVSQFGKISATGPLPAEEFTAVIRKSGTIAMELSTKTARLFLTDTEIVRIKGTTHTVEATLYGRAILDSRALTATVGRAHVYGPSQCSIFASKVLFANVDGPGEIIYYGQPEELNRQVNGPGQITAGIKSPHN
ncbi:MAG: DUF2807 domain-containing protein [Lentisphaeria bacterium]|nr:DUF2807 domain-containing protein [Lentisphaeria bacterium]